jgi:thiamine-phosphate pyrophosphorylase
MIGLSTHNKEEIEAANLLDLDYIGLGAYRATNTKEDAAPLQEKLDALAALSRHPVAAIGGVRFDDEFEHVAYRVISGALYEGE